ncbi:MAG: hypothetical protein IPM29_18960 [Planctomycetes bacterium]|nr:hypothetical protein [Planctomycetota bacterium]
MTASDRSPRWPRLRSRSRLLDLLAALLLLLGFWTAFTSFLALGIVLLATAIGIAFEFPDPEAEERATIAAERARETSGRRLATARTPLTPTGLVRADDDPAGEHAARSIAGDLPEGTRVEIVNEVDGEWVVRLPPPSSPPPSAPAPPA